MSISPIPHINPSEYPNQGLPSVADRMAAGKALRQKLQRSQLGLYTPPENRPHPVALLRAQDATRLPDLVPIRYGRMLASPWAFLRGAAVVMISDVALAPVTGLTVQACGDAHLGNFGVFASAERNLIFGINDFDETYPGAWEWDLKRLAASVVVAGRYLGARQAQCEEAVQTTVQAYCAHLRDYADWGYLDLWYETITEAELLEKLPEDLHKYAQRMMDKAKARDRLQVLDSLTELVDDEYHIIESPPWIMRVRPQGGDRALLDPFTDLMQSYFQSLGGDRRFLLSHYRLQDVAHKVVGVGSVGTRCWVIYLVGKDEQDPLFLQVKEAVPSILAAYSETVCGYRLPDDHQGRRVVVGQRLIQGAPDIFLGWSELAGVQYYVRQLRDMQGSVTLEPQKFSPEALPAYGELCGWALALAHAKSGDAAMMAGYVGKGDAMAEAMLDFAIAYADQTEQDYDCLVAAAQRGEIPVAEESRSPAVPPHP